MLLGRVPETHTKGEASETESSTPTRVSRCAYNQIGPSTADWLTWCRARTLEAGSSLPYPKSGSWMIFVKQAFFFGVWSSASGKSTLICCPSHTRPGNRIGEQRERGMAVLRIMRKPAARLPAPEKALFPFAIENGNRRGSQRQILTLRGPTGFPACLSSVPDVRQAVPARERMGLAPARPFVDLLKPCFHAPCYERGSHALHVLSRAKSALERR